VESRHSSMRSRFPGFGQRPSTSEKAFKAEKNTYLAPYSESVLVQLTNASSPSRSRIWTPLSSSKPAKPSACIASHFLVNASSTLRAACIIIAHGAALSVAPMKPAGVSLLSKLATKDNLPTSPGFVHGGSRVTIIFVNGTCLLPVAGVIDVEFWKSMVHLGRLVSNHWTKCCCTAVFPGVPGTRGIKIGASIDPVLMSKSAPAAGRLFNVSSDNGVYAVMPRSALTKSSIRRSHSILLSERREPEIYSPQAS